MSICPFIYSLAYLCIHSSSTHISIHPLVPSIHEWMVFISHGLLNSQSARCWIIYFILRPYRNSPGWRLFSFYIPETRNSIRWDRLMKLSQPVRTIQSQPVTDIQPCLLQNTCFKKKNYIFILCTRVFACVCVCVPCVCLILTGQKRALGSLELEL